MSEIPKFEINSSKTIKSKKKFAYYLNDEKITLRKRFNIFGIFYIVNLFLILLNFWGFHHERIIETTLIALMIIMIIIFSLILNKLTKLKDKAFKYITHTYFLFLNIFNSIILVESAINKQDYSLPTQLYYFWMGYRFFAISLITKIFSRSSTVTIPTLFFELIYLIVRLNPKDEEIYKPILISILISLMYCYFFYLYDKFLTDDSQMKLYQKEDSYLFKKMLNMIPQALMIIDKDDYLFYSNLNAKNLIFSGSQIIKTKNKKIENFFKNLKIVIKEEDKEQLMTEKSPINTQKSKLFEDSHLENGNPTNRNLKETNGNLKETNDNGKITNYNQRNINEPYLFLPHDKNITGNYSIIPKSINLTKSFSPYEIQEKIVEENLITFWDFFQYLKNNLTNISDPIINNLLKTQQEVSQNELCKKENYFTLEFYMEIKPQLHYQISDLNKQQTLKRYFNVQMSIIEIREQLNFFFIFDDITLIKNISQIQSDAINYKDQLMASVSHELRTPLNGIINMIEHAICHSPGQINADFLHPALNSSKLLDSIINDFLDYSMINAGKLHLLFTTFNLRSACMDCIQLLEPMANLKGLTMKLIISKNTPSEIFSEPNRLKQVLLTLLNNAVKYTNKGQVLLEAFTKERKIHFAIKDTGMGINPEEKNRIRMIISEENYLNKVNKNSTGAGLGLKISSKLIELLNRNEKSLQSSSLHCHSELGKGSQFCFSIMNQDSREPTLKSDKIDSHVFESMNFKVGIKMIKKGEEFLEPCSENFQKIDEIKEEKQNISSLNHLDLEFNKEMIDQRFQIDRIYEFPLKIRRENVILIVDDDVYNLEVLKFFIKSFNYKAETAINGKEAIEKIKDSHHIMNYLLVLMDFNMPVMNGIEATSYLIKEMKEKTMKTIPIIGITAYVSKEEADKGIKAGMLEILHKPIKKEELKGILNKYIGFYENTPP